MHLELCDPNFVEPNGTTRDELVAQDLLHPWILKTEELHGTLERLCQVTLCDGRVILLARFAQAWYLDCFTPATEAESHREFSVFLSLEAMHAWWGLHRYLTGTVAHAEQWQAFLHAVTPKRSENPPPLCQHCGLPRSHHAEVAGVVLCTDPVQGLIGGCTPWQWTPISAEEATPC